MTKFRKKTFALVFGDYLSP